MHFSPKYSCNGVFHKILISKIFSLSSVRESKKTFTVNIYDNKIDKETINK